MKMWKRRMVYVLCFLMILPIISETDLMRTEAAVTKINKPYRIIGMDLGGGNSQKPIFQLDVEQGISFNIKDLLRMDVVYTDKTRKSYSFRSLKNVTFSNSNKKIASVTKSGVVKALKSGTTTVLVKYKESYATFHLEVVDAGTYEISAATKEKYAVQMRKLIQAYGTGITSKNAYKVSNLLNQVNDYYMAHYKEDDLQPVLTGVRKEESYELIMPGLLRYRTIKQELQTYALKNNPISTRGSKMFQISKAIARPNSSTMKLVMTKKTTADQIFGLRYYHYEDAYMTNEKRAVFDVMIMDMKTKDCYFGIGTAKEGSSTVTLVMDNLKFVKNRKYKLLTAASGTTVIADSLSWTKGKIVTCK